MGEQQWVQLRGSGWGSSPLCPEASTVCFTPVAVAQAGEGSSVLNLLCAKDQANENCEHRVRYFADLLAGYEGDSSAYFSHCFFLPPFSSSLHLCHCLQSICQVIILPFLKVVFESVYLRLRLPPTWQGLCAMLGYSVMSDRDLNLAKTHGTWFQDLMKLRFMLSHWKKFSERHSNK